MFVYKLVPEVKIYTQHQEMIVSSCFFALSVTEVETHNTGGWWWCVVLLFQSAFCLF